MFTNLIIIIMTVFFSFRVLTRNNGIELSLNYIVAFFILGYRTFEILPGLRFHPIEIICFFTILRLLIQRPKKYNYMPRSIKILSIFFIAYFIIDILTRYDPIVINEFKNTFNIFIMFFILQYIRISEKNIIKITQTYFIVTSMISIIGVAEFLFPSLISDIFGFSNYKVSPNKGYLFHRIGFLFWGSHLAANLIPPIFPIAIFLRARSHYLVKNNFILTFFLLVNLFAIYLSGNRISWLILTVFLILIILQNRNYLIPFLKPYSLFITIGFIIFIYSQPVEGRYISTYRALIGRIDKRYDSSGANRMAKLSSSISSIKEYPMGTGWSSQGWVHSDIFQIASTMGIIPGFILIFSVLSLTWKIFIIYIRNLLDSTLFLMILCFMIFVLISLFLNGNFLLIQTGMPLILFWALSDYFYKGPKRTAERIYF